MSISWTSGALSVVNEKDNSSTAIRTSDSAHYRVYQNSKLLISAGSNITKVVITCTSADYATALRNSLMSDGYDAKTSGQTVTVEGTGLATVEFDMTAQTRITKVEVTYTLA